MSKIWVGTNWKMTKTLKEGMAYTKELLKIAENISPNIELFIIPSHTSLVPIKELTADTRLHLGAQNMHWEATGAYTGEISPLMLQEIGIEIIELGHSERRQYFNETDEEVNKKALAAMEYGLKPLICIGENLAQKTNGISKEIVAAQLKVVLKDFTAAQAKEVLIAYEPVWAIGENGIPADAAYVEEIHTFMRDVLVKMYPDVGAAIPLLFGGSVNLDNYLSYIDIPDVNGLFIGRTAWETESFQQVLTGLETHLWG